MIYLPDVERQMSDWRMVALFIGDGSMTVPVMQRGDTTDTVLVPGNLSADDAWADASLRVPLIVVVTDRAFVTDAREIDRRVAAQLGWNISGMVARAAAVSPHLQERGLWNDPGSGRFVRRGWSSLKWLLSLSTREQRLWEKARRLNDGDDSGVEVLLRNPRPRLGLGVDDGLRVVEVYDEGTDREGSLLVAVPGSDRRFVVRWSDLADVRAARKDDQQIDALDVPSTDSTVSKPTQTYFHLTDDPQFALNPAVVPEDNSLSIYPRESAGLYVAKDKGDIEKWINRHGYLRPFLVEIEAPEGSVRDERWANEGFIPADKFDEVRVKRVIPIDAHAREVFGEYGWVEGTIGRQFDTNEPTPQQQMFGPRVERPGPDYKYDGPDVRDMPDEQVKRLADDAEKARVLRYGDDQQIDALRAPVVPITRSGLDTDERRNAVVLTEQSRPSDAIVVNDDGQEVFALVDTGWDRFINLGEYTDAQRIAASKSLNGRVMLLYARALKDDPEFARLWMYGHELDRRLKYEGEVTPVDREAAYQEMVGSMSDFRGWDSPPSGGMPIMRSAIELTLESPNPDPQMVELMQRLHRLTTDATGGRLVRLARATDGAKSFDDTTASHWSYFPYEGSSSAATSWTNELLGATEFGSQFWITEVDDRHLLFREGSIDHEFLVVTDSEVLDRLMVGPSAAPFMRPADQSDLQIDLVRLQPELAGSDFVRVPHPMPAQNNLDPLSTAETQVALKAFHRQLIDTPLPTPEGATVYAFDSPNDNMAYDNATDPVEVRMRPRLDSDGDPQNIQRAQIRDAVMGGGTPESEQARRTMSVPEFVKEVKAAHGGALRFKAEKRDDAIHVDTLSIRNRDAMDDVLSRLAQLADRTGLDVVLDDANTETLVNGFLRMAKSNGFKSIDGKWVRRSRPPASEMRADVRAAVTEGAAWSQEALRDAGFTHVVVYRGIKTGADPFHSGSSEFATRDPAWLTSRGMRVDELQQESPITSWSANPRYAAQFGDEVVKAVVPIEQIVSMDVFGDTSYGHAMNSGFARAIRDGGTTDDIYRVSPDMPDTVLVEVRGDEILVADSPALGAAIAAGDWLAGDQQIDFVQAAVDVTAMTPDPVVGEREPYRPFVYDDDTGEWTPTDLDWADPRFQVKTRGMMLADSPTAWAVEDYQRAHADRGLRIRTALASTPLIVNGDGWVVTFGTKQRRSDDEWWYLLDGSALSKIGFSARSRMGDDERVFNYPLVGPPDTVYDADLSRAMDASSLDLGPPEYPSRHPFPAASYRDDMGTAPIQGVVLPVGRAASTVQDGRITVDEGFPAASQAERRWDQNPVIDYSLLPSDTLILMESQLPGVPQDVIANEQAAAQAAGKRVAVLTHSGQIVLAVDYVAPRTAPAQPEAWAGPFPYAPTGNRANWYVADTEYQIQRVLLDEPDALLDGTVATRQDMIDGLRAVRPGMEDRMFVRFPGTALAQIVQAGGLKNQHQSRSSGGDYSPKRRREAEQQLAGVPLTKVPTRDRPISGSTPTSAVQRSALDQYGDFAVRLDPAVAARTTMTFGDSLAVAEQGGISIPVLGEVNDNHLLAAFDNVQPILRYVEILVHGGVRLDDMRSVHFYPSDDDRAISVDGPLNAYADSPLPGLPLVIEPAVAERVSPDTMDRLRAAGVDVRVEEEQQLDLSVADVDRRAFMADRVEAAEDASDQAIDLLRRGTVAAPEGAHPATPEDRERLKIPPGWVDVFVADDPTNYRQVWARDAQGRSQGRYTAEYEARQEALKFERVKELAGKLDDLDNALVRDMMTDSAAAVTALIRHFGLRPGSMKDTRARKQAYGASTLQARHVRQYPDTGRTTLSFMGKSGQKITVSTRDPDIYRLMQHWTDGKQGTEFLFEATDADVRAYLTGAIGPGFLAKDLRTLKANVMALEMVRSMRRPTTLTAFRKARNKVADAVAKALGNTRAVTLSGYINPTVFADWEDRL